jgi:hypothetical protein
MGKEPILTHVETLKGLTTPVAKAMGWYHYVHNHDQGKEWLVEWMKLNGYSKDDIKFIKACKNWDIMSSAYWLSRIAMNGATFSDEIKSRMAEYIALGIEKGQMRIEDEEADEKPKVNIQSRVLNKNSAIMDEFEELHDTYFEEGDHESVYDFLIRKEATVSAANYIKERITPWYNEVFEDDPQVKESFGKKLKYWRSVYQAWMDDLDRFLNNKKAVKIRKPREKKARPITKIVEKVQYQKQDNELKIVSVNPAELVGAKSVWLYNTKYRSLAALHSRTNDGLTVKGTTLVGYDEDTAISKKLRKPEETIAKLLSAGKVALRTIMDDIKTAPGKPNGRINSNTIILKVHK